jgi:hypothetical protein
VDRRAPYPKTKEVQRMVKLSLCLALVALCAGTAFAVAPATMSYQVMLTDDSDNPLENEVVELIFRLYDDPSTGSQLWTETHTDTTNSIGVVSVVLGKTTPFDWSDFDQSLWLEVTVDGDVLEPRRELASVPFSMHAVDANRLGGTLPAAYLTEAEAGASGTINDGGNPLDWTMLKNVPAGIADGVDNTSGLSDNYSLDADDGSPTDAVYVDATGDVGIGTTSPAMDLHLHRSGSSLSYMQITNGTTGATSSDGVRLGINGPGNAFLAAYEPNASLSFMTNGVYAGKFDSDGAFELGSDARDGVFELYKDTCDTAVIHGYQNSDGGRLDIMDDNGNLAIKIEADDSNEGGRIWVGKDGTPYDDEGIDLNGNWSGTNEPRLRVMGTSRNAQFRMDEEGDESVSLPQDAISAPEMLDEVGAAAYQTNGFAALTSSYTAFATYSITVPDDGYVLVIGSAQADVTHTTGSNSTILFGVSDVSDDLSSELDIEVQIDDAVPTGSFKYPVTCHSIFEATEGTNTFYFVGRENGGSCIMYDYQLSLIYFPTAYGTIQTPAKARADAVPDAAAFEQGPITEADIAANRAEAEAANRERLQRELDEIRARLDELESEM